MDMKNVVAHFNEQNPNFKMRLGELLQDVAESMCGGVMCAGVPCSDCPFEHQNDPEDTIVVMQSLLEELN
jgi:hypothetical protein